MDNILLQVLIFLLAEMVFTIKSAFFTYRVSLLIAEDDGPFDIFKSWREYLFRLSQQKNERVIESGELVEMEHQGIIDEEYFAIDHFEDADTAADESIVKYRIHRYSNAYRGFTCAYCVGAWVALFPTIVWYFSIQALLTVYDAGLTPVAGWLVQFISTIFVWGGISGVQSYMQKKL